MGIRVGMVGVGAFARHFIPLFQAHPLVDEVALCDLDATKLQDVAATYGLSKTYPSLDALCESDVDAVVIITQNWLHGPQAVHALRAGKHVYSAVPTGITVEEIATLVRTVEESGLAYMLGETSYYYPAVLYCRRRYTAGDFGASVYGEAGLLSSSSLQPLAIPVTARLGTSFPFLRAW
jgi:predicted dehydrogenase